MTRVLPTSVAVAVAAVLAGCASTPAEDDPVQTKLNDLDARVARIERVVANQSLVQLAQNLDAVQAETRRLRGRIEELENSNEVLKKQVASGAAARGGAYNGAGGGGTYGSGGAPGGGANGYTGNGGGSGGSGLAGPPSANGATGAVANGSGSEG